MRIEAYILMTRPVNSLMMFFAVIVGAAISGTWIVSLDRLVPALLTSYGLTGSSMVLNDYFDREVDAVNNPSRPIPAGLVSPRSALAVSLVTAGIGLVSSAITSLACFTIAVIAYATAVIYNWRLKQTGLLGNMAVSFAVVAPFLYGAVLATGQVPSKLLIFTLLAFLANTGREIVKGMADVEGDAKRGVRTVARIYGIDKAAYAGSSLYLAAVGLSPLPYVMNIVNQYYLVFVAVADAGFVYSATKLLVNPTAEEGRLQKKLSLAWMFAALVSFLAGSF